MASPICFDVSYTVCPGTNSNFWYPKATGSWRRWHTALCKWMPSRANIHTGPENRNSTCMLLVQCRCRKLCNEDAVAYYNGT